MADLNAEQIRARVAELGDWFHNMDLKGVRTAPNHFLYDYPANKFARFKHAIPADLSVIGYDDLYTPGGAARR